MEVYDDEQEEIKTKSHRYHLTLPTPTNVWVEMGVAIPGAREADALLLVFRMNEEEEVTENITYTQHKVDDVSATWIAGRIWCG